MLQNAMKSDDFLSVDQLKQKIITLKAQLNKMEDQFSADLLQNIVTQWQREIINAIHSESPTLLKVIYFNERLVVNKF